MAEQGTALSALPVLVRPVLALPVLASSGSSGGPALDAHHIVLQDGDVSGTPAQASQLPSSVA